jgi:hypothetical protein
LLSTLSFQIDCCLLERENGIISTSIPLSGPLAGHFPFPFLLEASLWGGAPALLLVVFAFFLSKSVVNDFCRFKRRLVFFGGNGRLVLVSVFGGFAE